MSHRHNLKLFRPGARLCTHLDKCIVCGSPKGDEIIYVRVLHTAEETNLKYDGGTSRPCHECCVKLAPDGNPSEALRQRLEKLNREAWVELRKRGCPCCEAGLAWEASAEWDSPRATLSTRHERHG
jgi:hypothetical protein